MTHQMDRLKGFDADKTLELCREFLGGPWNNVTRETFRFTPLEQGFGNRLIICEIADDSAISHDTKGPRKVLVRLLGGNALPKDAPMRTLDETGETLVFYCLGSMKLGPQLFGAFQGGRVEQFIESRTLTLPEWLNDTTVNEEIARVTGKFHCATIPIRKVAWDLVDIVNRQLQTFDEKKQMLEEKGYLSAKMPQNLLKFDFAGEIEFVKSVLPKLKQRIVFSSNDTNRSNYLRLKDPATGEDKVPCEIMAIDYEFASYNYRGYDLGNLFGMKVFDFGSKEMLTGAKYPDDEYVDTFVRKYVETIRNEPNRPDDWDESGLDSVDHIKMEIAFGCFAIRLMNLAWVLRDLDRFGGMKKEEEKKEEGEMEEIFFIPFYREQKQHFLTKYPQFAV